MSKSNYLPGILLCALACIHFGFACNLVELRDETTVIGRTQNALSPTLRAGGRNPEPVKDFGSQFSSGEKLTDERKKVKSIYDSQIGVRETTPNGGPHVESYLRYAGLAKGNPWCAAFVCWVLGQAHIDNPRSGWSPDLFPKDKVVWTKTTGIKPGSIAFATLPASGQTARPVGTADVFGIYFTDKKRIAHAGFIDALDDSWLLTVEGNTNESGSREGDGVYRKRRPVSTIYKVARYID